MIKEELLHIYNLSIAATQNIEYILECKKNPLASDNITEEDLLNKTLYMIKEISCLVDITNNKKNIDETSYISEEEEYNEYE